MKLFTSICILHLGITDAWLMHRPISATAVIPTSLSMSSDQSTTEDGVQDLSDKTLFQRVFYRFTPGSDVDIHNSIVVEERVRFELDPERDGYIRPIGPRTIILRDGNVEDGEIGDDFFTMNVHEKSKTHNGAGLDQSMECTIATAMYLASNPSRCEGKMLEVSSNLGLAGLLGCIGAAFVLNDGKVKQKDIVDEILTVPDEFDYLLPKGLDLLTLTDPDEESLNLAFQNAKSSGVKASKVVVEKLDWSVRPPRPRGMREQLEYKTIISSDLAFSYPEAKELARTVANRLEPSGPYIYANKQVPRFIHICPDSREDVAYLYRFLDKGYRMSVSNGYLKLEKLTFVLQRLTSSEPESALDDLELELQQFKETPYRCLTAQHHPDYAGGGSGELFFPMETGTYDGGSASPFLEREQGKGPW